MVFLLKKNCAKSTLNGGISDIATSVTVTDATSFPASGNFLVTIWDNTNYPDPCDDPNSEIVKVTGVSGNIFTIQRAQESTTGVLHSNGDMIAMLITAGTFEELETAINAISTGDFSNGGDVAGANRSLGNTDTYDLSFLTNNLTRLFIKSDGKVGIGTLDPQSLCHISSSSNEVQRIESSGGSGWIRFNEGVIARGYIGFSDTGVLLTSMDLNSMVIRAENSLHLGAGGDNTCITIKPDGKVGIGTISPDTELDVAGQIKLSGGSPGLGKHLESDATGIGTWESNVGHTLLGQDLNGDLQLQEDYFGQGGFFELDSNYNRMPKTTLTFDFFLELDGNGDIMLKDV